MYGSLTTFVCLGLIADVTAMARISYDDPWKLYPRSALYYTSDGASITSSTGTPYLCLSRKDLWDLLSNMLKFNLEGLPQDLVLQLAQGLH